MWTKGLRGEIAQLDNGLVAEIAQLDNGLRGEMQQMEARLSQEIGEAVSHAVDVALEQNREYMGLLDEKYQHVPSEQAALRSEVAEQGRELRAIRGDRDAHIADAEIH